MRLSGQLRVRKKKGALDVHGSNTADGAREKHSRQRGYGFSSRVSSADPPRGAAWMSGDWWVETQGEVDADTLDSDETPERDARRARRTRSSSRPRLSRLRLIVDGRVLDVRRGSAVSTCEVSSAQCELGEVHGLSRDQRQSCLGSVLCFSAMPSPTTPHVSFY